MCAAAFRKQPLELAGSLESGETDSPLHPFANPRDDSPLPTVLVVDDDMFVRQAVAVILQEAKAARVHGARDGDEALRMAPALLPDLVILDLKMPGPPPHEVCRQLRALRGLEDVQICVLTGILAEPDLMRELRPYIAGVLGKPPDPRKLFAVVDQCRRGKDDFST